MGWRTKLAANKQQQWINGFTKLFPNNSAGENKNIVKRCLDNAIVCRNRKVTLMKDVLKNSKFKIFIRFMNLDPSYRTCRNAALDSLANVHDAESAHTHLAFILAPQMYQTIEAAVHVKFCAAFGMDPLYNPLTALHSNSPITKILAHRKTLTDSANISAEKAGNPQSYGNVPIPAESICNGDLARAVISSSSATLLDPPKAIHVIGFC